MGGELEHTQTRHLSLDSFLDYLRNGRGNVGSRCVFAARVRRGFPIATPMTWKQVEKRIRQQGELVLACGISPIRSPIGHREAMAHATTGSRACFAQTGH
jgi:hypothetical protein